MLKAIIVDDEEFARSSLYFLLQENCPNIQICGIAKSVREASVLLAAHEVALIFLDIAIPVENGFALIPLAQSKNANVIFTTAYDQYALKAIKANALDYLLKPIAIDELKIAVEKAEQQYLRQKESAINHNESLKNLAEDLAKNEIDRITLTSVSGFRIINIDDILHVAGDSNYSIFHLTNGETITASKVLKEYEELLPHEKFARVHKSSIVNLNFIEAYHHKNGLLLTLTNGERIAVSRRRATDFFERIKFFTEKKGEKKT